MGQAVGDMGESIGHFGGTQERIPDHHFSEAVQEKVPESHDQLFSYGSRSMVIVKRRFLCSVLKSIFRVIRKGGTIRYRDYYKPMDWLILGLLMESYFWVEFITL